MWFRDDISVLNLVMRLSRKSKLDHLGFDLFLLHGWCRRENGGSRSLLLASNAFRRFAESFAGNGCRPALSESPCRRILRSNLVSEGLPPRWEVLRAKRVRVRRNKKAESMLIPYSLSKIPFWRGCEKLHLTEVL
jgi:hypothetical protein